MTPNETLAISPESALTAAYDFFARGLFHSAHRSLHTHLGHHPECGRGWELLGILYHRWQQHEMAEAALENAQLRVALSPAGQCALADCHLANGLRDLARQSYLHLCERPNVEAETLLRVAAGLDVLGSPLASVQACRRALEQDSDLAQAAFDLAFYLGRTGAPAHIIEASARRAVDLAPRHLPFRIGLAGFLQTINRSRDAAVILQGISLAELRALTCRCCLARLIAIFEAVGDDVRAECCRIRQATLTFPEGHGFPDDADNLDA